MTDLKLHHDTELDLTNLDELEAWAKAFGCTVEELIDACIRNGSRNAIRAMVTADLARGTVNNSGDFVQH